MGPDSAFRRSAMTSLVVGGFLEIDVAVENGSGALFPASDCR